MNFEKKIFAKWVLAGEYSVLRSGRALVYPLNHYFIRFKYHRGTKALSIKKTGDYQESLDFSVTPVLHKALKILNKNREQLKGVLEISAHIPFGAGLGASSSLCVGLSYLFLHKKWIKKPELKKFAISLEDIFHGKSSGMDITAVIKKKPILYSKGKILKQLESFRNKPKLFLSYSGGRASTSFGVAKVRKLFDKNWTLAESIDKQMCQSAALSLEAIDEKKEEKTLSLLKEALDLGEDCFKQWELLSHDLKQHIQILKKQGAIAAKPTGSGLGGYVISLWDKPPPSSLKEKLIALNI